MTTHNIILNWTFAGGGEDGFNVYISTDGTVFTFLDTTVNTNYTATGLILGQQYWFRVTAFNLAGESSYLSGGPISCNGQIILNYDNKKESLYISSVANGKTYILSKNGMGMREGVIYSIISANNEQVSVGTIDLSTATPEVEIISDIIDFGTTGIKCIEHLDFGFSCNEDVTVALEYRMSKNDAFSVTGYKTINEQGFVFFGVRGTDFKVRVKSVNPTSFNMDFIKFGVQFVDKRNRRGVDTQIV